MPKRTEEIISTEVQGLLDAINNTEKELARAPLPELPYMPNHNQFMSVRGLIVTLENGQEYLKVNTKRIAVSKTDENDIQELPSDKLPKWDRFSQSTMDLIDLQTGEPLTTQFQEYDDVQVPVLDEENNPVLDEENNPTYTIEEQAVGEPITKIKEVNVIQYITWAAQTVPIPVLLQPFAEQFVQQTLAKDPTAFDKL